MKLYATVSSERATKGQGGNSKIITQLYTETENGREIIGELSMTNIDGIAIIKFQDIVHGVATGIAKELKRVELKGKSQKGE
jgi:hypothetical protein